MKNMTVMFGLALLLMVGLAAVFVRGSNRRADLALEAIALMKKHGAEQVAQDRADRVRWDAWATEKNCTVSGGKVIKPDHEVVVYECADGTSWEVEPRRAPKAWLDTVGRSSDQRDENKER